jgi:tRNA nucleotidyltransferase (CCA-adding enzyme)
MTFNSLQDFYWLSQPNPGASLRSFFKDGSLEKHLPEVFNLYGVPQSTVHHPEIDTGVHIELCLNVGHALKAPPVVLFAVLLHDIGKGITPVKEWPSHKGHEEAIGRLIDDICKREVYNFHWVELAKTVGVEHIRVHRALEMTPQSVLELFERLQVTDETRLHFFQQVLQACEIDARGRAGLQERLYPQAPYLEECLKAVIQYPITVEMVKPNKPWAMNHHKRLSVIREIRKKYQKILPAKAVT